MPRRSLRLSTCASSALRRRSITRPPSEPVPPVTRNPAAFTVRLVLSANLFSSAYPLGPYLKYLNIVLGRDSPSLSLLGPPRVREAALATLGSESSLRISCRRGRTAYERHQLREYAYLQGFLNIGEQLRHYDSAFAWRRPRVRASSTPLRKSGFAGKA